MKKNLILLILLVLASSVFAQDYRRSCVITCNGCSFLKIVQEPQTARMIPLTELGSGIYKGFEGGLYSGGSNIRPAGHNEAGKALAVSIAPLSSNGMKDPKNGSIVLLSIGMSNTTQEFSTFISLTGQTLYKSQLNPRLTLIDGAQGGQDAKIVADTTTQFWKTVDARITAAGKTRAQVQCIWLKEAMIKPTDAFPIHAEKLEGYLQTICHILHDRFPNLKMVFLSSRIYAGYATTNLNPEPYAYESGFSVKWLIQKQIIGDPAMAYDGKGVVSPYIAWGPYLWADSTNPRKDDGLFWTINDFVTGDRTHPSDSGRAKVARQLFHFFSTDSLTMSWFLVPTSAEVGKKTEADDDALSIYPNPATDQVIFRLNLNSPQYISLKLFSTLGIETSTIYEGISGRNEMSLNVSSFPPGIYECRLQAGDKFYTKKVNIIK